MAKIWHKFFPYILITSIVIISSFVLWLPFLLKISNWLGLVINNSSFQYVYKNYDGPLYIIVAKTIYNPHLINKLQLELHLSTKYFAAHLLLYPLIIKFFASFLGFLKSMIAVNLLSTVSLATFFYLFVRSQKLSAKPLLLTIVFLFLPRFLVVRSVGSPESLFIFLILASLFFFEKQKYILAGIMGALATTTKTPGILLFFSYLLTIGENFLQHKKVSWRVSGIFFIPLSLIVIFLIYFNQYGDFFAYFHSGDNIHLAFPFFSVFNYQKTWIGTVWLEEIIFYYFLYLLTVLTLQTNKYRSFFYFSAVFFIATILIQHRDISRYSLPLWPFACIAFERFFTSKKFLATFIILLPAIYFYAWNFLIANTLPISNWKPFL